MHAAQKRIFQREPRSSPNLFFDPRTRLYQVGRLSSGRHTGDAGRERRELATLERVRIRRVGNVDLADANAVQEQRILCGGPRQIVVEDPGAGAQHRSLPFAGRECQREPRSKISAVVKRVLPIVPQPKRKAKAWQYSHRVLRKSAGLLLKVGNFRFALICLEQIRRAHVVLDDISVLINTAKLKRSAKIRCFEDMRPLIPDRCTKKEAMLSAD